MGHRKKAKKYKIDASIDLQDHPRLKKAEREIKNWHEIILSKQNKKKSTLGEPKISKRWWSAAVKKQEAKRKDTDIQGVNKKL